MNLYISIDKYLKKILIFLLSLIPKKKKKTVVGGKIVTTPIFTITVFFTTMSAFSLLQLILNLF